MKQLVGVLLAAACAYGETQCLDYTVTEVDDYQVCWSVENDKIELQLSVATEGWVGFGIGESSSGGMKGADIAVISNGVIQDMYTGYAKTKPKLDSCDSKSDWIMQSHFQVNGRTVAKIQRALIASDPTTDRSIEAGTTRIILAYGTSDLGYHGKYRKAIGITFIENKYPVGTEGELEIQFKMSNFTFSGRRAYGCQEFDITTQSTAMVTETHYISSVATMPVVNGNYQPHHVLLYGCSEKPSELGVAHKCDNNPCTELVYAWAVGDQIMRLPKDVGLAVGGEGGFRYFSMMIHYDNPLKGTATDNSSISMRVSATRPLYEAQMLQIGDPTLSLSTATEGIKANTSSSYAVDCTADCTNQFTQTASMMSIFYNMNGNGKRFRVEHHRNNQKISDLVKTDYFDVNIRTGSSLTGTLMAGDKLTTYCEYHQSKNDVVSFGAGSSDEVCTAFILLYPKIMNKATCGLNTCNGDLDGSNVRPVTETSLIESKTFVPLEEVVFGSAEGCSIDDNTFAKKEVDECEIVEETLTLDFSITGITVYVTASPITGSQTVKVHYPKDTWLALGKAAKDYFDGPDSMDGCQTIVFLGDGSKEEYVLESGKLGIRSIDNFFTPQEATSNHGQQSVTVTSTSPFVLMNQDTTILLAWGGTETPTYHGVNRIASKPVRDGFRCSSAPFLGSSFLLLLLLVAIVFVL